MRKVLLATTTLVGVSLATGNAGAAEKIKLELGGYMEQYFGGFGTIKKSDNGKARDGLGIDTENRLYVEGSTVLDNGFTLGAFISFIAEANTEDSRQNVEEQFLWMEGPFGAFYLGERNGVFDAFAVRAPNVSGRTGQDTMEWVKYAGGTYAGIEEVDVWNAAAGDWERQFHGSFVPTLETTLDDNAPRVSYVTPSWYGFNFGISYAPNSDLGTVRGVRVREGRRGSNELQIGLALDTTYEDIGILADAGFATTLDGRDRWAYRFGGSVSYTNWTFGASYMGTSGDKGWSGENGGTIGNAHAFHEDIWELGVAYEIDAYGASLTYTQNDSSYGNAMVLQLGGAYKLGAGVTAVSQVFYAESNAGPYGRDMEQFGTGGIGKTYRSGVGAMSGLILEF